MINFEKANLIPVSKEDVEAGSRAIMINDMVFVLGSENNINVSATTATAKDVKTGKQFYNSNGELTHGTNTDVDVSTTTATAADVSKGKQFYDAEGNLTEGTLVPSSGDGSYDVNDDLDSINTALYTVDGTTITITSAEAIEDVNAELDKMNTQFTEILGE